MLVAHTSDKVLAVADPAPELYVEQLKRAIMAELAAHVALVAVDPWSRPQELFVKVMQRLS